MTTAAERFTGTITRTYAPGLYQGTRTSFGLINNEVPFFDTSGGKDLPLHATVS